MRYVFLLARLYPYWAIALIMVSWQLGAFFRRRSSPYQNLCWVSIVFLSLGFLGWFFFRGDLYSDAWLRKFGG